jgi:hypothetical protein
MFCNHSNTTRDSKPESGVRFMECLRAFFEMHWDCEPVERAAASWSAPVLWLFRPASVAKAPQDWRPLGFTTVHWDHEPLRTPGQGTRPTACRPGALAGRFTESPLSLPRMYWDHEPTPSPAQEGSRTGWPVPLPGRELHGRKPAPDSVGFRPVSDPSASSRFIGPSPDRNYGSGWSPRM